MYHKYLATGPRTWISFDLHQAFIFDVDGTLAIKGDRSPFDYSKVGEDTLNKPVAIMLEALRAEGYSILIVSGREDSCEEETEEWLDKHDVAYTSMFMRKTGDHRKDYVVKEEIYRNNIEGKWV